MRLFLMYVCICKGITQKEIQSAVEAGASLRDIRKSMGVASECGSCGQCAKRLVKQTQDEMRMMDSLSYAV
ncbi:(2Fe-2S)-binding protein [Marinomonas sp. PE14-40]|uniref:(2Fe-2S)-binding protein n=1 Tax=Marinomonas sp. PE14-40 TaxID=3060621 RepID=UPI003F67E04B